MDEWLVFISSLTYYRAHTHENNKCFFAEFLIYRSNRIQYKAVYKNSHIYTCKYFFVVRINKNEYYYYV